MLAAAQRVAERLVIAAHTATPPVLVLFCGVPGSGKSFLARRLQPHLQAVAIETDYVRRILLRRPTYSGPESAWVYAVCHALIAQLLTQRHNVIFDATNLVERNRQTLYGIADQAQAVLAVVHTVAPDDVIRRRLLERIAHPAGDNYSEADIAVYEGLRRSEQPIRRRFLEIDTTQDTDHSIQIILRWCRERP